jgi:tetratricopeptide (TPR) repeat protein
MISSKHLCMTGMRFVLVMLFVMAGSARAASTEGMRVCQNLKNEAEVRILLQRWRNRITPMLEQKERERVETYANGFPIDQASDAMPITFDYSEDKKDMNIRPIINRRDWAYAYEGFLHTFKGGVYEGSGRMVDIGFWCFLQASLLKMEPDHLSNVGFHLNNQGAFDDAVSVLCYARSLNVNHSGIHNNLAYTQATIGNFHGALAEQSSAVALDPYMSRYRDKMKMYGKLAGLSFNYEESALKISSPSMAFAVAQSATAQVLAKLNAYLGSLPGQGILKNRINRRIMNIETDFWQCESGCGDGRFNPGCSCNCSIKRWRSSYSAMMEYVNELTQLIDENVRLRKEKLIASMDRMNMIIEKHRGGMSPDEIRAIYEWIYYLYDNYQSGQKKFFESYKFELEVNLMGAVEFQKNLKEVMEECNRNFRDEMFFIDPADYFGRRPGTIVLKQLNSDGNKTWKIWFVVGSLDLHPDDTANLSFGIKGVLSGKLMYNFRTKEYGSGVGMGLNLGKAFGPIGESLFKNSMKFEFFAEVDSEKGPRAGIETGISPRVGVLHTGQKMVIRLEN